MSEDKPICSYCHQPVGNKHTFSYGIPGIKRVFGCDRWWCKTWRPLKEKRNKAVVNFVKRLYALLDIPE